MRAPALAPASSSISRTAPHAASASTSAEPQPLDEPRRARRARARARRTAPSGTGSRRTARPGRARGRRSTTTRTRRRRGSRPGRRAGRSSCPSDASPGRCSSASSERERRQARQEGAVPGSKRRGAGYACRAAIRLRARACADSPAAALLALPRAARLRPRRLLRRHPASGWRSWPACWLARRRVRGRAAAPALTQRAPRARRAGGAHRLDRALAAVGAASAGPRSPTSSGCCSTWPRSAPASSLLDGRRLGRARPAGTGSSPRPRTGCRSGCCPALFELQTLPSAGDRLAQPLTYWNGQGALAALGLVLAAGLAPPSGHRARGRRGADPRPRPLSDALPRRDRRRPRRACAVLLALQPTKATLRAVLVTGAAAGLAALAALALPRRRGRRRLLRAGRGDDRRPARS